MTSTLPRRISALAVWLTACGAIAIGLGVVPLAQGIHSGTIRGTVVDEQRAPIRSVTVTLTSPALQGRRTAIPRDDGSYGFWQLPPGDYEITFEPPAFAPVTRRPLLLFGLSVELNVTLNDERAT